MKARVTVVSGESRLPIVGRVETVEDEPFVCCACDVAIVTTWEKAHALGWQNCTWDDGVAVVMCPDCAGEDSALHEVVP